MGAFLVLCVLGFVAFMLVGAIASFMIRSVFWLVTLPFRIFFKLLFGLGGALAGLLLAPFVAVIAAIAVVVAVVGGVIALLAPLLPLLLLGLFAWAIYRLASRKPSAPPPPHPGFWS